MLSTQNSEKYFGKDDLMAVYSQKLTGDSVCSSGVLNLEAESLKVIMEKRPGVV
jgi:hypothetical protein